MQSSREVWGKSIGWRDRWAIEYDAPNIPMNQIYYNFISPYSVLKGKTPAEAAGIGVYGKNKWMELLKRSLKGGNKR